jgi:hypothetical protein
MKQTAVEFLESQYKFHGELYETAIEQAKEMEEEQSIKFACEVYNENYTSDKSFKQVAEESYKKTFKK